MLAHSKPLESKPFTNLVRSSRFANHLMMHTISFSYEINFPLSLQPQWTSLFWHGGEEKLREKFAVKVGS